jgi:hypothetical protein
LKNAMRIATESARVAPGPEPRGDRFLVAGGREDLVCGGLEARRRQRVFDEPEDRHAGRAIALAPDEPPRAFGEAERHHDVHERRHGGDAEHPAPRVSSAHARTPRSMRKAMTMPKTMLTGTCQRGDRDSGAAISEMSGAATVETRYPARRGAATMNAHADGVRPKAEAR